MAFGVRSKQANKLLMKMVDTNGCIYKGVMYMPRHVREVDVLIKSFFAEIIRAYDMSVHCCFGKCASDVEMFSYV